MHNKIDLIFEVTLSPICIKYTQIFKKIIVEYWSKFLNLLGDFIFRLSSLDYL